MKIFYIEDEIRSARNIVDLFKNDSTFKATFHLIILGHSNQAGKKNIEGLKKDYEYVCIYQDPKFYQDEEVLINFLKEKSESGDLIIFDNVLNTTSYKTAYKMAQRLQVKAPDRFVILTSSGQISFDDVEKMKQYGNGKLFIKLCERKKLEEEIRKMMILPDLQLPYTLTIRDKNGIIPSPIKANQEQMEKEQELSEIVINCCIPKLTVKQRERKFPPTARLETLIKLVKDQYLSINEHERESLAHKIQRLRTEQGLKDVIITVNKRYQIKQGIRICIVELTVDSNTKST